MGHATRRPWMTMTRIDLPSASLGAHLAVVIGGFVLFIVATILVVRKWRQAWRLAREVKTHYGEAGTRRLRPYIAFGAACQLGFWSTVALVSAIGAISYAFEPSFVALSVGDRDIHLERQLLGPVVLKRSEVESIELIKRQEIAKWRLVINTSDGRTFRSVTAGTYKETARMEEAYRNLRELLGEKVVSSPTR
jgi:hypothetical protein